MSPKRAFNSEEENKNTSLKKLKMEHPPFSSNEFLKNLVIGDKSA